MTLNGSGSIGNEHMEVVPDVSSIRDSLSADFFSKNNRRNIEELIFLVLLLKLFMSFLLLVVRFSKLHYIGSE